MRSIAVFFIALSLFSKTLDLPVRYDPFYKASKIIETTKKTKSLRRKSVLHLQLYAIFNNRAYINGRFYSVGDRIGEYMVKSIKKDYVLLVKNGTIKILPLLQKKVLRIEQR